MERIVRDETAASGRSYGKTRKRHRRDVEVDVDDIVLLDVMSAACFVFVFRVRCPV